MKRSAVPFPLPKGVSPKFGSLYVIGSEYSTAKRRKVWTYLCRITEGQAAMYRKLAELTEASAGNMPAMLDEFAKSYLVGLSPSWRKESARMIGNLKTFFAEFNVAQVDPSCVQNLVNEFGDAKEYAPNVSGVVMSCIA